MLCATQRRTRSRKQHGSTGQKPEKQEFDVAFAHGLVTSLHTRSVRTHVASNLPQHSAFRASQTDPGRHQEPESEPSVLDHRRSRFVCVSGMEVYILTLWARIERGD